MNIENEDASALGHELLTLTNDRPLVIGRKKVLYIGHTSKFGGGEIAIYNLVSAIDRSRYEPVFILAAEGPLVDKLRTAQVETIVLPLDPSLKDTRKDSLGLRSLLKVRDIGAMITYTLALAKQMRLQNADIVHTNSLKAHIYGGVAARIAGVPVVWHIRDGIDSEYLPKVVAFAVRTMARFIPNFVVANSGSTLGRLGLRRTDETAVVYSGIHNDTVTRDLHVSVLHDACDPDVFTDFEQNTKPLGPERPVTVTMVGRIAEWKGQHIFLHAASIVLQKHPQTIFRIVGAPLFGEFDYEKSLFELTAELNIAKSVQFLGFRNDVPDLIRHCDILVHASIIGEPFGQVVIEGMASGKAVIATNGGALPEIIEDGVSGCLVTMGSVDELAGKIENFIDNPEIARGIGLAGRQRVKENFTIDRCAERIHDVYEQMLIKH